MGSKKVSRDARYLRSGNRMGRAFHEFRGRLLRTGAGKTLFDFRVFRDGSIAYRRAGMARAPGKWLVVSRPTTIPRLSPWEVGEKPHREEAEKAGGRATLRKAKYRRRWRDPKTGEWRYEYEQPRGGKRVGVRREAARADTGFYRHGGVAWQIVGRGKGGRVERFFGQVSGWDIHITLSPTTHGTAIVGPRRHKWSGSMVRSDARPGSPGRPLGRLFDTPEEAMDVALARLRG